jgi:hypothetical protein
MKFGTNRFTDAAETNSRDRAHEIAEALSLWRSAMHHVAAQRSAEPRAVPLPRRHRVHWGLLLTPALGAAVAAGVLLPTWRPIHHERAAPVPAITTTAPATDTRASIDDTALMNHIDSELSEEVPDALRPLADPGQQKSTKPSAWERSNVTQE